MAQAGMEEWDSLATATLFMLVQEEFEIEFDLAELERLDSFPRIEEYLILHNSCSSRSIGD
jgi:acyl carrier protein